MLVSLLALVAMALSTGVRRALTGGPIVLEITPTLELALIAVGVIAAYGVATRWIWQRPVSLPRNFVDQRLHVQDERSAATAEKANPDTPTRGAA